MNTSSYTQKLSDTGEQVLWGRNPVWTCTTVNCSRVFIARSALKRHQKEDHKSSKYHLAYSNAALLKQQIGALSFRDAWNQLLNLDFQEFDLGVPPPQEDVDSNYAGPLRIVGFVKVGGSKLSIEVIVAHGEQRTLAQMMHGIYGQHLLADFFKVRVSELRSVVVGIDRRALCPVEDLRLTSEKDGLRIKGYTADTYIDRPSDLIESRTGRQLLKNLCDDMDEDVGRSDYVVRDTAKGANCSRGCLGRLGSSSARLATAFLQRSSDVLHNCTSWIHCLQSQVEETTREEEVVWSTY